MFLKIYVTISITTLSFLILCSIRDFIRWKKFKKEYKDKEFTFKHFIAFISKSELIVKEQIEQKVYVYHILSDNDEEYVKNCKELILLLIVCFIPIFNFIFIFYMIRFVWDIVIEIPKHMLLYFKEKRF